MTWFVGPMLNGIDDLLVSVLLHFFCGVERQIRSIGFSVMFNHSEKLTTFYEQCFSSVVGHYFLKSPFVVSIAPSQVCSPFLTPNINTTMFLEVRAVGSKFTGLITCISVMSYTLSLWNILFFSMLFNISDWNESASSR